MTVTQSYEPLRRLALSREEIADLSRPDFEKTVCTAAWLWFQIVCAMSVAWILLNTGRFDFFSAAGVALCACLVGNRYYSLFILGHDGLHRRLHPDKAINDLFTDLFIIGPLGAVTHRNRTNHMVHHRSMGTSCDPDIYKYAPRNQFGIMGFIGSFTALPFVFSSVMNVYHGISPVAGATGERTVKPESLTGRDIAIIGVWQAALVTGLSVAFGWCGYLFMWLAPVYVFTFCADIARVYCEHSVRGEEAPLSAPWSERLVTFSSSFVERAIFAPMNMNFHTAHHLWPAIAWHNLPRASQMLHARSGNFPGCPSPIVRTSYMRHILQQAKAEKFVPTP